MYLTKKILFIFFSLIIGIMIGCTTIDSQPIPHPNNLDPYQNVEWNVPPNGK